VLRDAHRKVWRVPDTRPTVPAKEKNKPLYIIMNLALAGAFPRWIPEFPLTMRVDYVRVYQR
jgi:beta-glucanase (GH16 family)